MKPHCPSYLWREGNQCQTISKRKNTNKKLFTTILYQDFNGFLSTGHCKNGQAEALCADHQWAPASLLHGMLLLLLLQGLANGIWLTRCWRELPEHHQHSTTSFHRNRCLAGFISISFPCSDIMQDRNAHHKVKYNKAWWGDFLWRKNPNPHIRSIFFPWRSGISRTLKGFIGSFSFSNVTRHFHPLTVTVPGFGCKPKEGFPLLSATSQGVMLKAYYRIWTAWRKSCPWASAGEETCQHTASSTLLPGKSAGS